MRYHKGSVVCLRPRFLASYRQVYEVADGQSFTVAHVEPRGRKNVLYLATDGRDCWVPAYPGHVRKPKGKVRKPTNASAAV